MKLNIATVLSFIIGIPGACPLPLASAQAQNEPNPNTLLATHPIARETFAKAIQVYPRLHTPIGNGIILDEIPEAESPVNDSDRTVYAKTDYAPNRSTFVRREDNDPKSSLGRIIPFPTLEELEKELGDNPELAALVQAMTKIDGATIEHQGEPRRRDLEATFNDHFPEERDGLASLLTRDIEGQAGKSGNALQRRFIALMPVFIITNWALVWITALQATSAHDAAKGTSHNPSNLVLPFKRRGLDNNLFDGFDPSLDGIFSQLVLESLENISQEEIDKLLNLTAYDTGNMRPALSHDLTLLAESLRNISAEATDTGKLVAQGVEDSIADDHFTLPVAELSAVVAWITMEYMKKNSDEVQRRDLVTSGMQGNVAPRILSEVELLVASLGEASPKELEGLIKKLSNKFSPEEQAIIKDFIIKSAGDAPASKVQKKSNSIR